MGWAIQGPAQGLFALLRSKGRGVLHEWQLLRLGGTHGQQAPVLRPSFGGATGDFWASFSPHRRALYARCCKGGVRDKLIGRPSHEHPETIAQRWRGRIARPARQLEMFFRCWVVASTALCQDQYWDIMGCALCRHRAGGTGDDVGIEREEQYGTD